MNLTNEEKETIIVYNEKDRTASVFTYRPSLQRQLDGLCVDRPEYVRKIKETSEGAKEYEIPKKWVKIRANRILSDEQRLEMSERMKARMHAEQNEGE